LDTKADSPALFSLVLSWVTSSPLLYHPLLESLPKFEHFRSIATATTVPGFKKTDVEELRIPILDLAEQRYIVSYLDNLQSKVVSLKQLQSETSAELDALLPSILDKAFKGELR
jgi:restriction endonuclease S subunit